MTQYPHCDSNVLHAPGVCEFCDRHPDWQADRVRLNINFTGEQDPLKWRCPAELERPLEQIERWHGNVPETAESKTNRETYFLNLAREARRYGFDVSWYSDSRSDLPSIVVESPSRFRRVLRFWERLFR